VSQADKPRYSILIPTRNGLRYLPHAVESVLSQSSNEFELVVSDNHSTDGTAAYLSQLSDPRLSKLKPDSELSMMSHFEFIVSHAKGDWVTVLGDDDGLMPFFFEYLASLKLDEVRTPCITFARAYYFWEGCEEIHGNQVVAYSPSARTRYVRNDIALLSALLSLSSYMNMPQLYTTGLVRKSYIDMVKEKSEGRIFHYTAPDAASAAILAIHASHHYRVEQPVFWTGTSPKSVGYSQGSSKLKERSIEFDKQNGDSGLDGSSRMLGQVHDIFDFSVILYNSLLSCPRVPKLWLSPIVRNILIAGLLTRDDFMIYPAISACASKMGAIKMRAFVVLIKICKFVDNQGKAWSYWYRHDRRHSLHSTARGPFPTLKEASDAILKLERGHLV
jgi:hypothetical protein